MQGNVADGASIGTNACLLHPHMFSSTSLGTSEAALEPIASTSYLASDDGVSCHTDVRVLKWLFISEPALFSN